MNKYNTNNDLDFDFDDDDFGLLDSDESKRNNNETLENVEENIREMGNRMEYSAAYNDEEDDTPLAIPEQQSNEVKESSNKEVVIYVLTDRPVANLTHYLRQHGVAVSRVFNNIKEAGDQLMFEMNPCRLVIADTGLGKFTGVSSRKEIIDVLSMVDEDHFMTVFYTDKFLKNEVRDSIEVDYKKITWHKYKSTAELVARLLLSKEKFILSDEADTDEVDVDDILTSKGLTQLVKESKHSIGTPAITEDQLLKNLENPDYEELKAYKVKY